MIEFGNITACYRCGSIDGDLKWSESKDKHICGECGEDSIVTFQQALDILNDLYVREELQGIEIYDEYMQELVEAGLLEEVID